MKPRAPSHLAFFLVGSYCGVVSCLLTCNASTAVTLQSLHSFLAVGSAGPLVQTADGNLYGTSTGGGAKQFGSVFRISTNGVFTDVYSFAAGEDGMAPVSGLVPEKDGSFYGITAGRTGSNYGTIFRVSTNGTLNTLHVFSRVEGPPNGLLKGSDGDLYGTTFGNPNDGGGVGTVFRLMTNGAYFTFYSFLEGSDGAFPQPGLIQARDGSLYGTTHNGGIYGFGTVFRMTTNGEFFSLYSFGIIDPSNFNFLNGACPAAGLIEASDGNLYGTTAYDGYASKMSDTVFRLTPAGDYTKLYTFPNTFALPKASLIEAADGSFYGTTVGGLYRITTNGVFTTLWTFPGGPAGGFCLAPLAQGADGNLYGTTQGGEPYNSGIVFQVTTNGRFTVLHQLTTRADGMTCNGTLLSARDGCLYGTTQFGGANGPGTIFKLGLNGIMSIIHDFNFTDGDLPGALVQDLVGNLYGTTAFTGHPGPVGSPGTGFRFTTNGTFTTIYSFTGGADGYDASAKLVYSTDGNLYGVTSGTVFRLTTAGTLTTIYSFGGGLDGASANALVQATDGAFYGTTGSGGASSTGTVFRITSAGIFNSLYSFTGHGDGAAPTSLVQASDGMLYGTATQGGIAGYGTLFRVSTNGSFLPLYSFSGGSDGAHPTASLMQAKDGWLYGSTSSGGSFGGGTIFRITTSGDFELLYSFSGGDGVNPGSLVEATDGWLYGTTSAGGVANYGTLFRISLRTSGALSPISYTRLPGSRVGFSFLTTTGQTYVVQESAGLAPPSWATITNFVGDGGRFELDVSTGPQSAMFLKITTP